LQMRIPILVKLAKVGCIVGEIRILQECHQRWEKLVTAQAIDYRRGLTPGCRKTHSSPRSDDEGSHKENPRQQQTNAAFHHAQRERVEYLSD
jgi:hypothetical protein